VLKLISVTITSLVSSLIYLGNEGINLLYHRMIDGNLQFPKWICKLRRKKILQKKGYSELEISKTGLLVDYSQVQKCTTCGFNPKELKRNERILEKKTKKNMIDGENEAEFSDEEESLEEQGIVVG
jgi:hypothetical protein